MSDWRSNKLLFQISIAILILLDISAIVLNGLIAYVLKRHKKTRIITFWFIYCLSISDVMVGVTHLVHHMLLIKLFSHPRGTFLNSLDNVVWRFSEYFLSTSGRLIFIIAVDRCIHTKYLIKYSTIMTQFRAHFLLFLNGVIGLIRLIPPLLLPEGHLVRLYFGINIVHTVGTIVIYIIYIKTYFCLKRQVATLQTLNSNDIVIQSTPDNTNQCHSGPSTAQHFNGCMKIKATKEIRICKTCLRTKDNVILESQQKALTFPYNAAICLCSLDNISENANDIESNEKCSDVVENLTVYPFTKVKREHAQPLENKQASKKQNLEGEFKQKQQGQRLKPDREFFKTVWLILIALFICFLPTIISRYYSFAVGHSIVFTYVSAITMLLNSTLNAAILIARSRELKDNIKSIFEQCFQFSAT